MGKEAITHAVGEILKYARDGGTFQSDRITEVPYSSYLDPDQWRQEMDLIFLKVPLALAASAEMPNPGDYKAMEAVGKPVLMTRDKDGKVHAFLNVCGHRGAPLAEDGCGHKNRFSCPYHGWTYSNDGKLMGVAEADTFGQIDKENRALRALPCEERHGLIFVILTPGEKMDLDGFFQGMLDDFGRHDFKNWAYLGSREVEGANWKIAFDGYLEGYHFAALHPETIHPRTFTNKTHYEAFGPHLRIAFPQVAIEDKLKGVDPTTYDEIENHGYDFVRIFFPNVSIFLAPEITSFSQLFPGPTPDKNKTVIMFFRKDPPKDAADAEGLDAMMDWLYQVVRDEDYKVGQQIQRGLESGAFDSIILGKNERGNQFFHEYLQWYLNNDKSAPKPKL